MDLDDESDSDNSSDTTMEFSDDTTQRLIDSLAMQVSDLQLERAAMREEASMLINKLRRAHECIIKSDT